MPWLIVSTALYTNEAIPRDTSAWAWAGVCLPGYYIGIFRLASDLPRLHPRNTHVERLDQAEGIPPQMNEWTVALTRGRKLISKALKWNYNFKDTSLFVCRDFLSVVTD